MPDRPQDEAWAGFALVEVLVSLALAALVGVLVVETMRIAGRTVSAVKEAEAEGQVGAVRDHLRLTLSSLSGRHVDGTAPAFQGGPDRLTAAIAPDRVLERPAELVASLGGVARTDGGYDVVERRAPPEASDGTGPGARAEMLLEKVAWVAIRYFGAPAKGAPPQWLPTWNRTDRQPAFVEVRIGFGPADRRRWPPLVVATGEQP